MTILFKDGFESGDFSQWLNLIEILTGSAEVTTFPFLGTYGARFQTQPTLSEAYARVNKTVVGLTDVYARGYFYIAQPLISALGAHDRFYVLRIDPPDLWYLARVGVRREGTVAPRWCLAYRGGHTYGGFVDDSIVGKWICIEAHYSKAEGLVELYVDGEPQIQLSLDTTTFPDPSLIKFGVDKPGAVGQAWDPTTQYLIDLYADECVVADQYIGPYVPPPPPCPAAVIATSIYGSGLELNVLRSFRDNFMARTASGRFLAKTYYDLGKYVAPYLQHKTYTKRFLRGYLDLLIKAIKETS